MHLRGGLGHTTIQESLAARWNVRQFTLKRELDTVDAGAPTVDDKLTPLDRTMPTLPPALASLESSTFSADLRNDCVSTNGQFPLPEGPTCVHS